jgi:hypothetical protein
VGVHRQRFVGNKTCLEPDRVLGKVKVKLSLCFNLATSHEGTLGEWTYSSTHFLTSALDGEHCIFTGTPVTKKECAT